MRLNLGGGDKYYPGWINCDLHGEVDLQIDCTKKLPFESSSVDHIESIHFVEHVNRMTVDNMILEWHRVLKPGGTLTIEVPCLDKIVQMIIDGEKNLRMTMFGIFGDPRDPRPGMMHAWSYTKEELSEILRQCGFYKVEVKDPKFHHVKRDMRVEAVKP